MTNDFMRIAPGGGKRRYSCVRLAIGGYATRTIAPRRRIVGRILVPDGTSMSRAAASAMSRPLRRAMTAKVMSIPADTPDDVMTSPSSTQRACRCQRTRGPCLTTQSHALLLDVAGRPSSRPVRANNAEPVQTVVVYPWTAHWLMQALSRKLRFPPRRAYRDRPARAECPDGGASAYE